MGKKIHILCDDRHDYVAKVKGEKIKLKHSQDEGWCSHVQGSKIGELEDHGNGIKVNMGDLDLDLDYSEFLELYLLLHTKMKEDKNMVGKVKYLKQNKVL